mgnify:CR=1 FL=1
MSKHMDTDRLDEIEAATTLANTEAYWYAWGRMDAGDAPPVGSNEGCPNSVDSAWRFAAFYASQKKRSLEREGRREGGVTYGLISCWEEFRESGGRRIEPAKYASLPVPVAPYGIKIGH